jgi:tRNA 5-methylaminomethyl-2-thiouridine biosynthesis bifunctional protein
MSNVPPDHGLNLCLEEAPLSVRDGVLRADDFDDLYFSAEDGLAETNHVFLEGNDLARRLMRASHFTIAETGFGTGLNFLAVLALVERLRRAGQAQPAQIDYISIEARPLTAPVIRRAHEGFSQLSVHGDALCAALPPRWPGLHRRNFLDGAVRLHLIYGDAADSLKQAHFHADAWFLDGFSPAKNPLLWSAALLADVGRLTRAGGSMASFTAARAVRENLAAAGFDVQKRPGYGRKRDMITGIKASGVNRGNRHGLPLRIGVLGGGIAGASVAAGLVARGAHASIVDMHDRLAAGASGNRLGLQSPRLSVDNNPLSRLSATCLSYAAWCSDMVGATLQSGVASLDCPEREAVRHAKFRQQRWPADLMIPLDNTELSAQAGIPLPLGGMLHAFGRVIAPAALTSGLASGAERVLEFEIKDITRQDGGFAVTAKDGRNLVFDRLVLAVGANLEAALSCVGIDGIPVEVTSGQVSQVPAVEGLATLATGLSFGGYLTVAHKGFHELGASFDRSGHCAISDDANQRNRDRLPAALAALMPDPSSYGARVSRRVSAPDRAPLVGALDDGGLFMIGGLGAHGLTTAPLLGDMLAAHILGMPMTLDRHLWQSVAPYRFRLRASRL